MMPIQKILVGYDFSEGGDQALRRGLQLGQTFGADLEVLHILQDMPYEEAHKDAAMVGMVEQLEKEVSQELNDRVDAVVQGKVRTSTQVRLGIPYRDLLYYGRECGADLLVLGNESQAGLKGMFIGRTAESALRKALTPVFVERRGFDAPLDTVMVPTDLSASSRAVAQEAIGWAERLKAKIRFLHVVDVPLVPPFSLINSQDFTHTMSRLGQKKFDQFLEALPLGDLDFHSEIAMGDPAEEILNAAKQQKVGLMIIGTHGAQAQTGKWLGSVAKKVLDHAPCHALSLRPSNLDFSWLKEAFYSGQ